MVRDPFGRIVKIRCPVV